MHMHAGSQRVVVVGWVVEQTFMHSIGHVCPFQQIQMKTTIEGLGSSLLDLHTYYIRKPVTADLLDF